jgi:quercetin dioxygenase-like cupin family protein
VELREEIAADAALFVLGQLDDEAKARFEARLKDGCEITRAELAAFGETAASLGSAAPSHAPPPGLRSRLMARIAAETPLPQSGVVVVRARETGWFPGPAPGVEIRLLHKKRTMLVRMAPGARLPVHHHDLSEQCLVIEGTVTDGEVTVGPGDFVFMAAGTTHRELWSETGATFLIAYS